MRRIARLMLVLALALVMPGPLPAQTADHHGQVIEPVPLGKLVEQSFRIVVLQVDRIDRGENLIVFKQAGVLKGKPDKAVVRLHFSDPAVFDWARPGKRAVCFSRGSKAVTCLGRHWYYNWGFIEDADHRRVWSCADWVDGLLDSYAGPAEELADHVKAILAGREVVVTARAPRGPFAPLRSPIRRDWLRGRVGPVWRIKAGRKVREAVRADDSPYFVGWGVGGREAVRPLTAALESRDARVRAAAVADLGQLGVVARPALPAMRRALRDPDPFVRLYAVEAVAGVDPEAAVSTAAILAALGDGDVALRHAALGVVASLGVRSREAVSALVRVLRQDREGSVRRAAAFVLGSVGPGSSSAGEVVAALTRTLGGDREQMVRYQAARALANFGARAWPAVPVLSQAVRVKPGGDRVSAGAAADVLTRFRPPAVEVLAEAAEDPQGDSWAVLIDYLAEPGPGRWAAVPALRRVLRDSESPMLVERAGLALLRLDRAGSHRVVPKLVEALQSRRGGQVEDVVAALGELGPDAREAVPALAGLVRSPWPSERRAAVEALARVGPEKKVRPLLRELLRDEVPSVRLAAARGLARVGGSREAVPELEQALADESGILHARAALALRRIRRGAGSDPGWERAVAALDGIARAAPRESLFSQEPIEFGDDDSLARGREDAAVTERVAEVLYLLAREERPVLALEKALAGRDYLRRMTAAVALSYLDPRHRGAPAILVGTLEKHPGLLPYLAGPLADLGPRVRAAVPWLLRAVREGNRSVYRDANRALRGIDPGVAARVWGVSDVGRGGLKPGEWDRLWGELASGDAARAYQAEWRLVGEPGRAVRLLRNRLRPVPTADPGQIDRWITDLESERFAVRERASAGLAEVVEQAEPALRRLLQGHPSLERRRRMERLLKGLEVPRSGDRRRALRAVTVLEEIRTPEAREVLRVLAGGAPEAGLTREAKAALGRLDRRNPRSAGSADPPRRALPPPAVGRHGAGEGQSGLRPAAGPFGPGAMIGGLGMITTRLLPHLRPQARRAGPDAPASRLPRFAPEGPRVLDATFRGPLPGRWASPIITCSLAFSPDCKRLASGRSDGVVCVWDLPTGTLLRGWRGRHGAVRSLAFAPDGRTLAAGCERDAALLWEVGTGRLLRVMKTGRSDVHAVLFSPRGKYLVVDGEVIKVWDPATGTPVRTCVLPEEGGVEDPHLICLSPDGQFVVAMGYPGMIHVWDVRTGRRTFRWDLRTARRTYRWRMPALASPTLIYFAGNRLTAVLQGEGSFCLCDLVSGKQGVRRQLPEEPGFGTFVTNSTDGRILVRQRPEGEVELWEAASGQRVLELEKGKVAWTAWSLSPDGRAVAVATQDGKIRVWDVTGLRRKAGTDRLADGELEKLWDRLAQADAPRAYRAVWQLVAAREQSASFLAGRLRPVVRADPEKVARLVQALDAHDFATREKARKELEARGDAAADLLRANLKSRPPLEVRRRIERLLSRLSPTAPGPLRQTRVVQVLEQVGTAEAIDLLERLGKGLPSAHLTQEARTAAERLRRSHRVPP